MINEVNVKDALVFINEGAVVLDVRTKEEYKEGHIDGSKNIDIHDVTFKEQIEKFDKSKKYIVCCASGARSARAIQMMIDTGFIDTHNLLGGMTGWKKEGLGVVE